MRRPIFLDRDGVINVEPSGVGKDYVTSLQEFKLLPNAVSALRLLVENGYDIYVISNQAGVGKGIFTLEKLMEITDYMLKILNEREVKIMDVLYCIHHPQDNCNCRKPKIGNLEKVWGRYQGLKKKGIFFVGDQEKDIYTAKNFSLSSILVLSGKTNFESLREFSVMPDYISYDLYDAVTNIILK